METSLTAKVGTVRVFSRTGVPPKHGEPPDLRNRMAATPVTEGPLRISKLASNEVTYLQVNDFTRALMARSRVWRVSPHELAIPASFSTYWLLTLSGPQHALDGLEDILRGLCRYEVCSYTPERELTPDLLHSAPITPPQAQKPRILPQTCPARPVTQRTCTPLNQRNSFNTNSSSFAAAASSFAAYDAEFGASFSSSFDHSFSFGYDHSSCSPTRSKTPSPQQRRHEHCAPHPRSPHTPQTHTPRTPDSLETVNVTFDDPLRGVRFTNPLVPPIHISYCYPRAHTLASVGPLSRDVTTVCEYIGLISAEHRIPPLSLPPHPH